MTPSLLTHGPGMFARSCFLLRTYGYMMPTSTEPPSATLAPSPREISANVTQRQEEKEKGKVSKDFHNEVSTFSRQFIVNYFFIVIKIMLS